MRLTTAIAAWDRLTGVITDAGDHDAVIGEIHEVLNTLALVSATVRFRRRDTTKTTARDQAAALIAPGAERVGKN